ncbi:hypothetical protein M0805_005670 [Coniferiporia weirii]|nr:hypothetical protein M0805_005670 [Coniferiporia weirii]
MRIFLGLATVLALPIHGLSLPAGGAQQIPLSNTALPLGYASDDVRPLVLWHGLGDSYASAGMLEFANLIKGVHPGIFVHSIYIEENLEADQRAGFYGNVEEQLLDVAAQLAGVPELSRGFDAIGFSQGGQFLRAYVEKFNDPPINNLLTFGSQHMGVADLPLCRPTDFMCQVARKAARSGVYSPWAQKNLIQAQYYRDPEQLPAYYTANKFLTSINNEIPESVNETYARNLATLSNLVLILFTEDKTVVPKESAWFGSFAPPEDELEEATRSKEIVPMRLQPTYLTDTFGLRTLDKAGGVLLETCIGEHMQITEDCWEPLVRRFVGGKFGENTP